MRTSKHKPPEPYQSAPTIQTLKPPPVSAHIRQRAHDIYVAHGGAERMTLSEWVEAEQDLKQELEGPYNSLTETIR
jgi:hypothetical protein